MLTRFISHAQTLRTFGLLNWLAIVRGAQLGSRHAIHPLHFRRGTSDLSVFRQVFLALEYACVPDCDPEFVLDCGANVGYASAYFLSRFPRAHVMAVEPDQENYNVLARNMRPYGDRVQTIPGAVWSHATHLSMAPANYRGGEEWARQVSATDGDVPAYGVADLLEKAGREKVDILKMDIEGAEAVVFGSGVETWIDRVSMLVIELHDDTTFGPASELVAHATDGFAAVPSGELTLFHRK